ncbi:MAG: hypothetical protein AAFN70_19205, partial [Planctomycetota bacterium]
NRLEIVDVDTVGGLRPGGRKADIRFTCISQVFSDNARTLQIETHADQLLQELTSGKDGNSQPSDAPGSVSVGQPVGLTVLSGRTIRELGGVESTQLISGLPRYTLRKSDAAANDGVFSTSINDIPMATRSSRSVLAAGTMKMPHAFGEPTLRLRRGREQLIGALTNPLPIALYQARLVYRGRVYELPSPFPAGGAIRSINSIQSTSRPFRSRLIRRRNIVNSAETESWNATPDAALDRLMEMLMFYDAAGGASYVGLSNRLYDRWDISRLLETDGADDDGVAVIYGRAASPLTTTDVQSADNLPVSLEQSQSVVRILLPVGRPE